MPTLQRRPAALAMYLTAFAALLLADPSAAFAAAPPAAWQQTDSQPEATAFGGSAQLGDGDVIVFGGSTRTALQVADSARYDAATSTWTATGPLPAAVSQPSAVTLADGRVLATGGHAGVETADASIFDPQSNSWTAVAPMAVARRGHTLTLLADGTVLAAGGTGGGSYFDDAERYDPVSDSWTPVAAMPSRHADHTATRLADGSVVVVGGAEAPNAPWGEMSAAVTRFDPATGTWSALPPLPQARVQHTTTLLPDGALLVVGGIGPSGSPRLTLRSDPADGSWRQLPGLVYDRAVVAPLEDGLLLLVQGSATTLLDTADGRLAAAGTAPAFRVDGELYRLPNGDLLRVGGEVQQASVDRFTPRAHAATAAADFGEQTTGRRGATVTIPVTTAGDVPLFVRGVTVEGADATDYAVTADSCTGAALEQGESCFVGIRFTPAAAGRRTASLVVSAPLLDGGRQVVPLRGDGVAAPVVPAPQPAPQPRRPDGGRSAARRTATTPTIRCGTRRAARSVVCTGLPTSLGRGKVRLSRGGIVYATGTLKRGRLTLQVRRRLFDRRYTLVIGGKRSLKVVID